MALIAPEVVRLIAVILGVFVIVVALWSAIDQARRHRRGDRRAFGMALRGLGTALGSTFILAEVIQRFDDPNLTYRSPLAIAVFGLVVVAIIGVTPRPK